MTITEGETVVVDTNDGLVKVNKYRGTVVKEIILKDKS